MKHHNKIYLKKRKTISLKNGQFWGILILKLQAAKIWNSEFHALYFAFKNQTIVI